MKASAMPEAAWVTPAPGTTLSTPTLPELRETASAMNEADCSSVTRIGSIWVERSRAS